MKRSILLMMLLLLLSGCAAAKQAETEPAPAVSALPTAPPAPTATPAPSPTPAPKITDAWYAARCEQMAHYMREYGNYASEEELQQALRSRDIDPDKPMIALTFDDGPMLGVTNEILDILEEYNVRVTFFVNGHRLKVEEQAALLPRMLALGCEIGNHTFNHDNLRECGAQTFEKTVTRTNDRIYELTGYKTNLLRPPGGNGGKTVCKRAKGMGLAVIMWSQGVGMDKRTAASITDDVFCLDANGRKLRDGDIVLLHDTKPYMVDAVRMMIPKLLDAGYQLVTVSELFGQSEKGLCAGVTYRSRDDFRDYFAEN